VAHASIERSQGSEETGDSERSGEDGKQFSAGLNGISGRDKSSAQSCLGGMADGVSRWLDEPGGTPRVIEGCPDRAGRLKALGNAVVPQIVEVLGKAIIEIENSDTSE
jgi:DNA (cytosine-5)-methyltransferase 1